MNKQEFLTLHPEFVLDENVGPILRCFIPLEEVVRQVRVGLVCVTAPDAVHPANKVAEQSYRAFLAAVESAK